MGRFFLDVFTLIPKIKIRVRGGVWSVNGIAPTLTAFKGGGSYPMIVQEVTKRYDGKMPK